MKKILALSLMALLAGVASLKAQDLKRAHLGDCPLEKGGVLHECELAYRTFGTLSPSKDNVILIPTWASGRTDQLLPLIGPGNLLDSSKYFVIAVDSFANGVSSSPSTSRLQPRMDFPQITIHDMVVAEHALLTRDLHLDHVFAVMGISMGGMQTFEWIVAYPDFMSRAIPIIGSPRIASYDRILWETQIDAIKKDPAWNNGNYTSNPAVLAEARIGVLSLTTPAAVNAQVLDGEVPKAMLDQNQAMDANDHIRQAEAMMALDVSRTAGGSMEDAAKRVKAKVLVIVSVQDHTVTPQPALAFAKLLNAQTVPIDSPCGHLVTVCELPKITAIVADFFKQ